MVTAIRRRLHYGWVIFALTFTNLTVEGGSKNVQAVFLVALRDHFRSSVALTAAVFSASGLFGAFMAPFLGIFLDRFGPRVLFPIAGCLILVGWLASSFASDLWQLFIFYSVIATLGQVGISSFSATATLAPWFPRAKGAMLGTADAGNPTGQAIVVPLAQLIVSAWGWQWAYRVFGVAFFLLVAIPNLLQKRPPAGHGETDADAAEPVEEVGTVADAGAGEEVQTRSQISETMREPAVWCLCAARAVGAIGNQMTLVHMLAFLFLTGYGELQAAFAIGIAGLMGIGARPAIGLLSDIFGREVIYTLGMSLTVAGVLIVLFFSSGGVWWVLVTFVALSGLSEGVGGLLLGAKAADIYPPRMLGTVMGVLEAGRGIGIGTGPVLAGLLFDLQGDYFTAFLISAGLTVVSIFLMWCAGFANRRRVRAGRVLV
ncbi:MAG: MFS transporter [Chloroflexi bacterium]|nr:MFS transporter [Chloroflexota bacterium]